MENNLSRNLGREPQVSRPEVENNLSSNNEQILCEDKTHNENESSNQIENRIIFFQKKEEKTKIAKFDSKEKQFLEFCTT